MRRIGSIDKQPDAARFCDYLTSQSIRSTAEHQAEDGGRCVIWVKDENRVDDAREMLATFLADPQNDRYDVSDQAEAIRRREREENRRRQANLRKVRSTSFNPLGERRTPVTIGVIAVCVIVGFLSGFGRPRLGFDEYGREIPTLESRVFDALTFVNRHDVPDGARPSDDPFLSIRKGQPWRFLTPALLHGGIGHLAMNMMGMFFLGSVLERLHGSRWLALVLLGSAALASLVQIFWPLTNGGGPMAVGASGATYGLFGYFLLRSQFDPGYPVHLPPMFQVLGLGFLVMGVVGVVPNIANGSHVGGLAAGMLFATLVPSGRFPGSGR